MRKLNTSDMFKMARIIKEANVKKAIGEIFEASKEKIAIDGDDSEETKAAKTEALEKKKEEVGFKAIMTVFEECSTEKLEKMFYELLGGITEKKPEDVAIQSLDTTMEEIKSIVSENNIANFFKQAGQLMK